HRKAQPASHRPNPDPWRGNDGVPHLAGKKPGTVRIRTQGGNRVFPEMAGDGGTGVADSGCKGKGGGPVPDGSAGPDNGDRGGERHRRRETRAFGPLRKPRRKTASVTVRGFVLAAFLSFADAEGNHFALGFGHARRLGRRRVAARYAAW